MDGGVWLTPTFELTGNPWQRAFLTSNSTASWMQAQRADISQPFRWQFVPLLIATGECVSPLHSVSGCSKRPCCLYQMSPKPLAMAGGSQPRDYALGKTSLPFSYSPSKKQGTISAWKDVLGRQKNSHHTLLHHIRSWCRGGKGLWFTAACRR